MGLAAGTKEHHFRSVHSFVNHWRVVTLLSIGNGDVPQYLSVITAEQDDLPGKTCDTSCDLSKNTAF